MSEALVRAMILTAPWFLNGMLLKSLSNDTPVMIVGWVTTTLFGGALLGQILLFLFNRPSRRGLHDLACGTYVARIGGRTMPSSPVPLVLERLGSHMTGVLIAAILLAALSPAFFFTPLGRPLRAVYTAVDTLPEVEVVGISHTQRIAGNAPGPSEVLAVSVRLFQPMADARPELARIAAQVLKATDLPPSAHLSIGIAYGFDFGFAHWFQTLGLGDTFAHWHATIQTFAPESEATTGKPQG